MAPNFDQAGFYEMCGTLLMLARKRKRLTQAVLADKIGVTRATVANIEAGRIRVSVDVVWRCAIVLRVNILQLIPERK